MSIIINNLNTALDRLTAKKRLLSEEIVRLSNNGVIPADADTLAALTALLAQIELGGLPSGYIFADLFSLVGEVEVFFDWTEPAVFKPYGEWLKLNGQIVSATKYSQLAETGKFEILPPENLAEGDSRLVLPTVTKTIQLYDNYTGYTVDKKIYSYILAKAYLPHKGTYIPNNGNGVFAGKIEPFDYLETDLILEKDYGTWIQTGLPVNLDEYPELVGADGIADNAGNIMPPLTANTSNGVTVTASSTYYEEYGIWKAFDGDSATQYVNGQYLYSGDAAWMKIDLGAGNEKSINSYKITPGNYSSYGWAKTWEIQGSNDGSAWITLHSVTDYTSWQSNTASSWSIGTDTEKYRYFRFYVTAQQYEGYDYMSIKELSFFGNQGKKIEAVAVNDNGQRSFLFAGKSIMQGNSAPAIGTVCYGNSTEDIIAKPYGHWLKTETEADLDVYPPIEEFVTLSGEPFIQPMTANSSGGLIASASRDSSNCLPFHAFDGFYDSVTQSKYTHWYAGGGGFPVWLQIDLGIQKRVGAYSLTMVEFNFMARKITSWQLLGSNNGTDWETLDTQTDFTAWTQSVPHKFNLSQIAAYRYYRINITKNINNGTDPSIGEMQLYLGGNFIPVFPKNIYGQTAYLFAGQPQS